MIELNNLIPENVSDFAKHTITIQESLMNINSANIEQCLTTVLNLPFIQTKLGVKNIANNILLTAQYRPFSIPNLATLSLRLKESSNDQSNQLSILTKFFLNIPVKILEEKWKVAFLYEAHKQGLFSDEELFQSIKRFLDSNPILQNKPSWKNNSRQHFLFFIWFAPLISKMDSDLFTRTKNFLIESHQKDSTLSNYDDYIQKFDQLMANNWHDYYIMVDTRYSSDSIADCILRDDVDGLKTKLLSIVHNHKQKRQGLQFIQVEAPIQKVTCELTAEEKKFREEIDTRIECSLFEYTQILTRKPTLCQFSAFCGSEKCFNFLLEHGANLKLLDCGKRNSLHFAIAGGNVNIIEKVASEISDFVGATRISAEFHRFELFIKFLTQHNTNLKANDIENGSIFHGIAAANHIKMILFCLQQGCNVNLKDGDGV